MNTATQTSSAKGSNGSPAQLDGRLAGPLPAADAGAAVPQDAAVTTRKIVVVGPAPGARGGMATVLENLAVAGFFADGSHELIGSYVDGSARVKLRVALRALGRLASMLVRRDVALVHVHSAMGASIVRKSAFVMLARAFRVPVVFQMHNGAFVEVYGKLPRAWRACVRRMLRSCQCVVVLTAAQEQFVRRSLGHPCVRRINNPVNVAATHLAPDAPAPQVGFFGLFLESKGVFDLLRAWALARARLGRGTLVLCGDGDVAPIVALAEELGVGGSLRVSGWIEGAEKERVMRESLVIALPSYSEAMPMTVLEAMAQQRAVLATRVGAVPEMVEDGVTGLVVEPGDVEGLANAIERLLGDPQAALRMGREGYSKCVGEFSADAVIHQIDVVHRQVLDR